MSAPGLDSLQNLPAPAKAGLILLGGGSILAAAFPLLGATGVALILIGIAMVAALILAYRGLVKAMDKRKANPFVQSITQNSAAAPQGISEPAKRARLDDLRKNFESGVEKFRGAGKNLYSIPWYLLVGEPGSGKTEAVRHCNVGFPPGLQDQLQGAGGTLNMNWWFTNHAIILDTAGRLMFEEAPPGQTSEWQEFLKLLKRARPNCPVNGMLLVIPADSLIRDTADQIEKKAGKIANQLDSIQRALGVRFPVFVVVTKCDLVNGFREFFDNLDDPQLQHQILGWSNPADLDQPFKPELVEEHLHQVRDRMTRRRTLMLQDPVNTENPSARRIDQVDALYAFPDSLSSIAPRLRRYLEMIFVAGEWSTKPLFLRGIYFTSSMREGSALDADLAEALGVSIESLPEGRVWERDRAYFLRDLFMQKVFKERGLVTQAGNVRRTQRRRRTLVMGAGLATVVLLIGLTILGGLAFRRSVGGQMDFWRTTADQVKTSPGSLRIVTEATAGSANFNYRGGTTLDHVQDSPRLAPFYGNASNLAAQPLGVPRVFALVASFSRGLDQMRADAARAAFEAGVIRPLTEAAARRLRDETPQDWSPTATGALAQLVRLDTLASQPGRPAGPSAIRIEPLLAYVVTDATQFDKTTAAELQRTADALYGPDTWAALGNTHATREVREIVAAAVPRFIDHWSSAAGGHAGRMGALQDLQAALTAFDGAEARLLQLKGSPEPTTLQEHDGLSAAWADAYKSLSTATESVDRAVAALGPDLERPAPELCAGAVTDLLARAKAEYDLLRENAAPAPADPKTTTPPPGSPLAEVLKKGFEDLDAAARKNAAALEADLRRLQPDFIDRVKGSDLRLYALRARMYAQADARLQAAAPKDNPEFGELARSLDAARVEADRSSAQIGSWQAAGAGLPRCDDAAALSKRMITVAQRKLTTGWVAHLLRTAPASGAEFVARVSDLAGRHPDLEPPRRPTLSMTAMEGGRFKAQFNPLIAQMVLADWAMVSRAIGTSEGVSDVLDAPAMREQASAPGRAYAAYAGEYVTYWSQTVPNDEAAFAVRDWPDFAEKARTLKPADANGEVGNLLKIMSQALGIVPPALLQDPALKSAKDRVANQFTALDERFDRRCRTVRELWVGLGATQPAARDALLRVPAKKFEEEYLDVYGDPASERGRHVFYWNNFVLAALNVLAQGTELEGREAIQSLQATAGHYPITLSDDRKDVLSPEQVAAARGTAQRLPATDLDPAAAGPRRERDDPLVIPFELRDRIAGGTVFRTEDERRWAARVKAVLTFLADAPQPCELIILDSQEQTHEPAPGIAPAYPTYRFLRLAVDQAPELPPVALDAPGKYDLRVRCPGPKAILHFRSTERGGDDARFDLDDAWNAVRLAQAPGAVPDDKDKSLLKVPLRFRTPAGAEVYYWIGVKFERPAPARSEWPTREAWPTK